MRREFVATHVHAAETTLLRYLGQIFSCRNYNATCKIYPNSRSPQPSVLYIVKVTLNIKRQQLLKGLSNHWWRSWLGRDASAYSTWPLRLPIVYKQLAHYCYSQRLGRPPELLCWILETRILHLKSVTIWSTLHLDGISSICSGKKSVQKSQHVEIPLIFIADFTLYNAYGKLCIEIFKICCKICLLHM